MGGALTGGGTVALVSPRYPPAIGGVERHVEALAHGLLRRGIPVEVLATEPGDRRPSVQVRDGVLVRRFPTLAGDGVYCLSPGLGVWLLRHAARFALVHAHSYHTPVALQAALAARRARRPLVVTSYYHGTGHSRLRRALHRPYRPAGAWLLRQARTVICGSAAEQQLVRDHFGARVRSTVVPHGLDLGELEPTTGTERSFPGELILAVNRLDPYKQTDRVIAALPHLPGSYRLVVAGDGPERPRLEQLAAALGVADRVRLLGRVPRSTLVDLYRSATLFVTLSRHESFGLTLLEAAAGGSAVVASDVPAYRETAGYVPAGRVSFIPPDVSPLDLARAIQAAPRPPRPTTLADWPLPTWDDTVEGTLACYRAAAAC
jgi:glycosyltransferase involved in cell wall biosynthesis